ncbi:hypothetical protein QQS21_011322 [Conoideocrella luteorostrata]|uniref:CFEM domain-containing protein n=1 Tax=Conoideocrella luteorostrata TaxID=1105319 RepID=A0AAJ0CDK0_9HYPO|nr:hypothetical protein QQS21_011322 [Conoideocrella luteorostrata]
MKSTLSLAVAAAGVQQVAATFGGAGIGLGVGASFNFDLGVFSGAKTFPCPANIINKCTPRQEQGWDFGDLLEGSFDAYLGFNFGGGWTCENNLGKRGEIQGRTFGPGKVISGTCEQESNVGLDIGVGAQAGVDVFSIGSFDLSTEFDARLEFHYDMPDGSVCKHTSDCARGGSTIINTQCGGAKKVRIVYPKQIQKGLTFKKKCKISCHKIKWHCGKPKPTTSLVTIPGTSTQVTETIPNTILTTTTKPVQETTSTAPGTTTKPGQETSSNTKPVQETTSTAPGVSTSVQQTTTIPGQQTTSTAPGVSTSVQQTTTVPGQQTTSTAPGVSTSVQQTTTIPGQQTTPATTVGSQTTTFVTTYSTTSTVFTTSTKTITSCGPTVTECPGKTGTHIVTVTVPVSTTICPVTETRTGNVPPTIVLPPKSETQSNAKPTGEQPTGEKPNPTGQQPTGEQPKPTGVAPPCPPVVPRCLNTFLELKSKCKDNKDAGCYCPNKEFVDTIFNCIYAHGENDNIISEAISFFQGICGAYIPQNPGIATGAHTITEIITVTGTPRITSVPYTTVVYATTIVEKSTTKTVSAEVTIPNIAMPAPTGGSGPQPTQAPPAGTETGPAGVIVTPPAVTGTGGVIPPAPTGNVPVTAGAGRVGAGMLIAVVAFVAAL